MLCLKKDLTKVYAVLWIAIAISLLTTAEQPAKTETDYYELGQAVKTPVDKKMSKIISVSFLDTSIQEVLAMMAKQADVDIIKSPEVTGSITATLTDVPLQEALTNILAAHNYGYVATDNMIRVVPLEKIYVEREKYINRVYRVTYADVKEVAKALEEFLSGNGEIAVNPGTSNIMVTDLESKIKAIDSFINEIDRETPQILVEARIYDISTKDRLDLGVNWDVGTRTTRNDSGKGIDGNTDPSLRSVFNSVVNKAVSSDNGLRFGILNGTLDIDVILRAEEEDVEATLLANPRVLVLDNEKALFKSISEIPYQELTETNQGGSIGTTSFREVGVELEVVPHVARDAMIRLNIKPKFSIATGQVSVGGFNVQSPQPVVDTRNADTTLLIKSGTTVVLGGLRKKEISKQLNKVPLLGDIPILGEAFKFEGEETVNSELVVFITPTIISKMQLSPDERIQLQETKIDRLKMPSGKVDRNP